MPSATDIVKIEGDETRSNVENENKETEDKNVKRIVENSINALTAFGDAIYSRTNDGVEFTANSVGSSSIMDNEYDKGLVEKVIPVEPSYILFFQVLFPFFVAGFGMVLAGIVLDTVQHWQLFIQVPETFILVPALLGLKGNLEMTLASRLSTLANTGSMDSPKNLRLIITSNLALVQVQAIIVAFLASSFAVILAWIPKGQLDWSHAVLLCASSLTTSSIASFLLGLLMVCVVLISKCANINPDNVATPLAASLGDLTTLGVLSLFGSFYLNAHLTESWLNMAVVILFLILAPLWTVIARRESGTRDILYNGWSPIIFSMLISSAGGFILETAIKRFPKMAVFQPVINGVGGNLAAVQASRLATFFHQNGTLGILPFDWTIRRFFSFKRAFFSSESDSRSARVLLLLVVPGHIFFNWLIKLLHSYGNTSTNSLFTSFYLLAALLQVIFLLYICQWLIPVMWSWHIDPDNAAIPYLTALGDLLGTFFLFITFLLIYWIKGI